MEGLIESIKALTTPEQWEGGLALFNGSGVMCVQINAATVEARVVNERGGLENVVLSNRGNRVTGRCSCRLHTKWCRHVIAVMLVVARESPEFLKSLCLSQDGNSASAADEDKTRTENHAELESGVTTFSSETIRDFIASPFPLGRLKLVCTTEMPELKLSTQRLVFTGCLQYNGNEYALTNIRKLVDNGVASGGMTINCFSPQAQRIMHFLVKYAKCTASTMSLESELVSDLFHCLIGSNILHTSSGVVHVNKDPSRLLFTVKKRKGDKVQVWLSIFIQNRGVFKADSMGFVAGRGGYWFGDRNEWWWFPGIIPFQWLRTFINGATITISLDELSRLSNLCETGVFTGMVEYDELNMLKKLPTGKMKPVLTLDWLVDGLTADLQFEYGETRVEAYGEAVVGNGKELCLRDREAEESAMAELKSVGFIQSGDTWHHLRIFDKKDIYNFITKVAPSMPPKWHAYWTPQVRLCAMMASDASFSVSAGEEGNGWFETNCDMRTIDGTIVPLDLVAKAIEEDDRFVRLENGAVVRLTDEIFILLRTLLRCAVGRHENRLNFEKSRSVLIADVLDPYWSGEKPDWCSLRDYLMHPERISNLLNGKHLPPSLRDYQRDGIKWLTLLEQNGFNGILADEMGLGKTVQALTMVLLHKKSGQACSPSLVVCPTSLLENWHSEAVRFTPSLKVAEITGLERASFFSKLNDYDLLITSYALLRRDILEYEGFEFDYIILDEAQHIKNPKTANAQACFGLRSRHRIILTGTPMENSLMEIWSLFSFLIPGYLGDMHDFRHEYDQRANAKEQALLTKKLSSMIRPFVLRRTKAEVCAELPPKLEQNIYCEMGSEQRKLYDTILLASRSFLKKIKKYGLKWSEQRMEMLAMITRLRQACCHPLLLPPDLLEGFPKDIPSVKMELAKEIILEALDSNHRILFFSQFTTILKMFPDWLKEANILFEFMDGSTRNRQEKVDRFNNDESVSIFLLSLKAGGIGLNLQGADTVIHFDQWWNPMVEDQATDRSHRIGQTRTVTSIRLVTKNTIEEKILKLQDAKRQLFNDVLGNSASSLNDISVEDVDFILS